MQLCLDVRVVAVPSRLDVQCMNGLQICERLQTANMKSEIS